MRGRSDEVGQEARAVHDAAIVVDLHVDTFLWTRSPLGYDIGRRHRPFPLGSPCCRHTDLPRLAEGGYAGALFGVVVRPGGGAWGRTRALLDHIDSQLARHHARIALTGDANGVTELRGQRRIAALLGVEGLHGLEGDVSRVAELARRGVTSAGLVHLTSNAFGHPANATSRRHEGLTRKGLEVIEALEHHRIIVDLAHLNPAGIRDALARCTRPPIASHTGIVAAHDHWRNLDRNQCRAIADLGGVIGIIFYPGFLRGARRGTIDDVVDHVDALVDAAGVQAVAIGSDFDGAISSLPEGLEDCSRLPRLTERLLARGYGAGDVHAILGGNFLRVLGSVRPRTPGE